MAIWVKEEVNFLSHKSEWTENICMINIGELLICNVYIEPTGDIEKILEVIGDKMDSWGVT